MILAAVGPSTHDDGLLVPPILAAPSFYGRTLLTTPTYDGSGEATHPGVAKPNGGWMGWLYWMAMTPLAANDETLENPSVLVSNDGTTWQVPAGLTNPIASLGTSDPDLVYHDGTMYLFYRRTSPGPVDTINVKTSTNGITWSADTSIITDAGTGLLSPAVVRDRDGTWRLWSVNLNASPNTVRMWTASNPLGPWTGPSACTASDPEGRDLWHLDVAFDGTAYRALVTTCTSGTSGTSTRLALGTSTDATTWSIGNNVLAPSGGSGFDAESVYRSSGVLEQSRWRVWYGARKISGGIVTWRIGYTEVDPADYP